MKQSQLSKFQGPDSEIRLELKKIKTFLQTIGNPQSKISYIIHIAGTNGKGSTLAFIQSLLENNTNLKIGKYTSPHLVCITERFYFNRKFISKKKLNNILEKLSKVNGFDELSYFEQLTAAAFDFFTQEKTDLLLLETGLGGRLDATNIIKKPTLCLITNISYDHQEFLGNTLEQIAYEKAGILKPQIPFLTTAEEPALSVIRQRANEIQSPELELQDFALPEDLGLKGEHQKKNANLALNAFFYLKQLLPEYFEKNLIDYENCLKQNQNWPGRFEQMKYKNHNLILDGAHNQAGAKALKENLKSFGQNKVWLLGFLKTKDYQKFLQELLEPNDKQIIILTNPTEANKSANLSEIKDFLQKNYLQTKIIIQEQTPKAFEEFLKQINGNLGIVSGSLYLIGKVHELMS